jgi:hypothetical protein
MARCSWLRIAENNTCGEGVASLSGEVAAAAASLAACSAADTDALVWIAHRPASMAAKKQRKKSGATNANSMVACPLRAAAPRCEPRPPMAQW